MADRERSKDGKQETQDVIAAQDGGKGVPGAFGKGDKRDPRATGVSHVRQDVDEIAPTEGRDND